MSRTQMSAPEIPEPRVAAGAGPKPRYQRRHWLIDPVMQGRFFLNMLFISALVGFGVTMFSAHYFLFTMGHAVVNQAELKEHFFRLAIGASIFAMIVLPVASIFLSHRFAGPAYRLRKAAESVAEGQYQFRIHLRRYDHLKPTAETFNHMLERLDERRRTDSANHGAAAQAIHCALEKLSSPDLEAELPEVLRLLEEAQARLR